MLISAYYKFCLLSGGDQPSLVFVGSGELEASLQQQARSLSLRVIERYQFPTQIPQQLSNSFHSNRLGSRTVYFYGFRQIEENATFYALADAFVLPSLREEWGLVVNEAMACSLPVIVSSNAGCAEDLLPCESSQSLVHDFPGQVQQRSNGFVFDCTSVDSLTFALLRIAKSDELRRTMGMRSRIIIEKFSSRNFATQALRAAEAALAARFQ